MQEETLCQIGCNRSLKVQWIPCSACFVNLDFREGSLHFCLMWTQIKQQLSLQLGLPPHPMHILKTRMRCGSRRQGEKTQAPNKTGRWNEDQRHSEPRDRVERWHGSTKEVRRTSCQDDADLRLGDKQQHDHVGRVNGTQRFEMLSRWLVRRWVFARRTCT